MNLRKTLKINKNGILEIGGCKTTSLAKKFKTPLYVMDVEHIENIVRAYKKAINDFYNDNGDIAFASKSFSCVAIYALMKQEKACIDVVSRGEMEVAIKANFNLKNAYFHGNNKLIDELKFAIKNNIGTIVVDNEIDLKRIDKIAKSYNKVQNVLIRINPGVECHTHEFIQTAKIDSKFGFSISTSDAFEITKKTLKYKNIRLKGFHSHIGSQIFGTDGFKNAIERIFSFVEEVYEKTSFYPTELNFGGGFAIHYIEEDQHFTVDDYYNELKEILLKIKEECLKYNFKLPKVIFEPGRSIVGEAGITLYSVGSIKNIKGIRKYINIDGGMTDNIRPALYNSKYEAIVANKADKDFDDLVTIAGKCCESGDIIIKDCKLQNANIGDIIAIFSTGAYNYSMASNYNKNLIPCVIFVKDGKAEIAVKRQSFKDLYKNDKVPSFLK